MFACGLSAFAFQFCNASPPYNYLNIYLYYFFQSLPVFSLLSTTSWPHLSHIPKPKVCSVGHGILHCIIRYPGLSGSPPWPLLGSTQAWLWLGPGNCLGLPGLLPADEWLIFLSKKPRCITFTGSSGRFS